MAARHNEDILREVAGAQRGVAARSQLVARGIPRHTIDRMIRSGRLAVLHPGVYQVGPLSVHRAAEVAAVLGCGADARISHRSAAAFHGIIAREPRPQVEVTMPRRKRRRIEGVRIHRVRDLLPDEVTTLDGIPITTPARTLLDIGETMSAREVEQALANGLRMGLVTLDEMRQMVERHPRHRGAPVLRRLLAMEEGPAFTRSEAEEKLLRIVRGAGLPRPELNVTVLGHEVDFLWRSSRVVVEVDGYAFHGSRRSFVADRRRDAELAAAGYRVLRFTWGDLTTGHLVTVARLAQALVRSVGAADHSGG
jgi:very-short-patch-repair endonuclease